MKTKLLFFFIFIHYCTGNPEITPADKISQFIGTFDLSSKCENGRRFFEDTKEILPLNMNKKVFGQQMATELIIENALQHRKYVPEKPLVFSFHGSPGTGKTFVAQLIADAWFTNGYKSDYFYYFNFGQKNIHETIYEDIEEALQKCNNSIFVFDDVDKAPYLALDEITSFINVNQDYTDVITRYAIFIFISNAGANEINEFTARYQNRQDIPLEELQEIIIKTLQTGAGGLKGTKIVKKKMIDYYIPFLPLTEKHVRGCIKQFAKVKRIKLDPSDIITIAKGFKYNKLGTQLFSESGCADVEVTVRKFIRSKQETRIEL